MSYRDSHSGGRHATVSFLRSKSIKVVLRRLKLLTGGIVRGATNHDPESFVAQPEVDPPEIRPPISHISRLPDELLIVIFDCVHACYFRERYFGSFYEWFSILRVCTHWRDIMFSTSRLWSVILVSTDLTSLRYCLALHGNTPLEVRMYDPWVLYDSLTLLRPHASSIRVLELHMAHMSPDRFPFDKMLTIAIPSLEELKFWPKLVLEDHNPLRSVVRVQRYPKLRRLELRGVISPPDITNLRFIKLEKCSWAFSFQSFIRTLGSCSRLVELHLERSLRSLALTAPRDPPASPHRATLPSLRKLSIADNSATLIAVVMAHLDIPAIASLCIMCSKLRPAREDETHLADSEHIVRTLVPADPSNVLPKFPSEASSIRASLAFLHDVCIVKVASTKLSTPISVELLAKFDLNWTHVVPAALQDISYLFSKTPITELVVGASSYHILPSVWEELFTSLPHLQRLVLTGNGTWTAMWQGLHRASAWAAQPCCPRLMRVHIRHTSRPEDNYPAPPDERDLAIIADALRERSEAGAQLEELVWAVYSLHHANYYASRGQFVTRLAPFVERVTYEDLGQWLQSADDVYPQINVFR